MHIGKLMNRTVAAFDARRQFGRLLQQVMIGRDSIIIEWHNQPAAVLVPMEMFTRWQGQQEEALDLLQKAAAEARLDEEEAQALAKEAATWARGQAKGA